MAEEIEMEKIRPNIRIEIHNNLTQREEMEVDSDENFKSDNEEGEIIDDNDTVQNKPTSLPEEANNRIWSNQKGIFTTGINIFDKAEQEKLQERARRFALKPDEIRNFTDADLEELHESLGITLENKSNVRFEAVHILGVDNLSTEDVLEYFLKYAPTAIEWVSENSCNVTWLEEISAARAMFYVSKVIQGMPARDLSNPFAKEFIDDLEELEQDGTGQSILLKNKNRIVELKVDNEDVPSKVNFKNAVDISEITIPIPPGYWRLGEKHPKAKCLLLRYALKTDKKPYNIEPFNKYYKHLSLSKGIISESKKKELRGIFDRNRELNQEKNPWGSLAKNWNRDAKFCERIPSSNEEKPVEIKNPSIRVRLGSKKDDTVEEKPENEENTEEEQTEQKKRIKVPRMRMYADEEEEKIKRKKLLQTLKKQTEKLSNDDIDSRDLRNVLGVTNNRRANFRDNILPSERIDLGTRLKNRTQSMVFTVEREVVDVEEFDRKENVQADIRSIINQRRARSPLFSRRIPPSQSPERRSPEYTSRSRKDHLRRSRSPIRRRSPVIRKRSPTYKRRHEGTLHSDRLRYDRSHRHRHRTRNSYHSEEEEDSSHKPRSKVAVVIKTQKKPAVASTIWSRVQAPSETESESGSSSGSDSSKSEEESSSSEESESNSEDDDSSSSSSSVKQVSRPGFMNVSSRLSEKVDYRSPLKITMTNDHFKK